MNIHNNMIQKAANTYFIVVAIFLFGVNTAMAASRPYLPIEPNWPGMNIPLAKVVSKIQEEQKESNLVTWVKYGSPHFSNPGVTSSNIDQAALAMLFGGFQDIDNKASSFEPSVASNQLSSSSDSRRESYNHTGDIAHSALAQQSVVYVNSSKDNKYQEFVASDETVIEEQTIAQEDMARENEEQQAKLIVQQPLLRNIWLDLDS